MQDPLKTLARGILETSHVADGELRDELVDLAERGVDAIDDAPADAPVDDTTTPTDPEV